MFKKMICAQPCPAITGNNEVVAEQMSVPVTSVLHQLPVESSAGTLRTGCGTLFHTLSELFERLGRPVGWGAQQNFALQPG